MKARVFQVGLLVASIFAVANMAHAETVTIEPLAVESYSKEFNVSAQEAERRLTIQSQLDYITKKLDEQFGDTIASVYFDNGQDFKLVVRTTKKGKAQKQVIDLTSQLSKQYELPIEVVTNSPRNFKAIQNIIENQGDRIGRQYESFQKIAYDPQKDAIYLGFYQPDTTKQNEITSKIKKISGMDVVIDFMPSLMTQTSVVGGGALENSSLAEVKCTAGFAGTMNNMSGFLTATHCLDKFDTYMNIGGAKYKTGTPVTDNSLYHEISFVPVNAAVVGEVYRFWGGNQTYRTNLPISGLGSQSELKTGYEYGGDFVGGTTLCHMGQRTGFSCGSVALVSGNLIICNAAQNNSIAVRNCGNTAITLRGKQLLQNGGDSGGPYFDGSGKAYGIASAGISYANDTMNVDISSLKYLNGFQLKTSR